VVVATGVFSAGLCFAGTKLLEGADYVDFWRPNLHFLTEAVRAGRVPLWNPYIALGRPFLADAQNAVFYPPIYLTCLGQGLGTFLLVWLHCALGVFGMRGLAAGLNVGRWQGYFMAACYLGGAPLTARWMTGQISYCWGLCYVPALFHCALRTAEPWRGRRIAAHALLLAGQFLCGHPQVFWLTAIGQGVFILGRALRLPLRAALLDAVRGLGQLGAASLWCAGLVSVLLLPFLELVSQGNRMGASPALASFFKLQWQDLESLISPLGVWQGPEWINWETTLFFGPIALVLGLAGLVRVRERNVRALLAVAVVAMLMSLGDATPCFALLRKFLPGYSVFRMHAREAVLVVLALICAAGIWLSQPHPRLKAWWSRKSRMPVWYAVAGVVLLQGLSLLYGTWVIKRAANYAILFKVRPDYPFRAVLAARLREAGLLEPGQPPPRVCVPWALAPPNYAMVHGYSSFDASCSLFLRRPWDYLHGMLAIRPSEEINSSLSAEVYNRGAFPYPHLGLVMGVDQARDALYVNKEPAPRAFVVYGAEAVGNGGTILSRLAEGHDIRRAALLETPLAESLPAETPLPATAAPIRRFEANWLEIEVEAKEKGLLVVAEAWYPGWRAQVDGHVSACLPANLWMRAVPIPAGRHQVRLYFRQDYLLPGLLISLVSIALMPVVWFWKRIRLTSPADSPDTAGWNCRAPGAAGSARPALLAPVPSPELAARW
jgi:hypothetical protein